jgi:hypothetical protein
MDVRAFIASLFFTLLLGLVALMLLTTDGADAGRIQVNIAISIAATEVLTTAAPPSPPLPPTAVAPIAAPTVNAPLPLLPTLEPSPFADNRVPPEADARWRFHLPVETFGLDLTYCHAAADHRPLLPHIPASDPWTDEMRAISAAGFAAWEGTGLTFHEVPYSPHPADCFVVVVASANPDAAFLGQASAIGPLWGMQNWIWSNTAQTPHNVYVVIHEVGHLLGLPHTPTGVMQPNVQFGLLPGQAEFAIARRFWFGEE